MRAGMNTYREYEDMESGYFPPDRIIVSAGQLEDIITKAVYAGRLLGSQYGEKNDKGEHLTVKELVHKLTSKGMDSHIGVDVTSDIGIRPVNSFARQI